MKPKTFKIPKNIMVAGTDCKEGYEDYNQAFRIFTVVGNIREAINER